MFRSHTHTQFIFRTDTWSQIFLFVISFILQNLWCFYKTSKYWNAGKFITEQCHWSFGLPRVTLVDLFAEQTLGKILFVFSDFICLYVPAKGYHFLYVKISWIIRIMFSVQRKKCFQYWNSEYNSQDSCSRFKMYYFLFQYQNAWKWIFSHEM